VIDRFDFGIDNAGGFSILEILGLVADEVFIIEVSVGDAIDDVIEVAARVFLGVVVVVVVVVSFEGFNFSFSARLY